MEPISNIRLETTKITAFIVKDGDEYVVYSHGKGGAMITATSKEEATNKFKEALNMVIALRNLIFYNEVIKSDDIAKEKYAREYKPNVPVIDFVESSFHC